MLKVDRIQRNFLRLLDPTYTCLTSSQNLTIRNERDQAVSLILAAGLKNEVSQDNLSSHSTLDAKDFKNQIKVILINHGAEDFTVTRGMRIAQLVIGEYVKAKLVPVDSLSSTERAGGGFGSSGY